MNNRIARAGVLTTFICLFLGALLLFPATAYGATLTQDGMELEITTDKTTYVKGDKITGYAIVTNTNNVAVNNVELSVSLPGALYFTVDNQSVTSASLAPNGTLRINFETTVTDTTGTTPLARTGDGGTFAALLLVGLVAVAGAVFIVAKRKDRASKAALMSTVLVVALVSAASLPMASAYAADERRTFSTAENITVKSAAYSLEATVSYDWPFPFMLSVQLVDEYLVDGVPQNKPLAGGTFTLVGGTVNETLTSDANGRVEYGALDPGTYTLTQTATPMVDPANQSHAADFYYTDMGPFTVTVDAAGAITIEDTGASSPQDVSMAGYLIVNYRVSAPLLDTSIPECFIDDITEPMTDVFGLGIENARITADYEGSPINIITPVIAQDEGFAITWTFDWTTNASPAIGPLTNGDTFTFYQTEVGKRVSTGVDREVGRIY